MRIAVAGAGSFAKYLAQELPQLGHEVVILTRSYKQWFEEATGGVSQRITDYSSADQLLDHLKDCDAVISTIMDYSPSFATTHLAILDACTKSPKCKRFIPSEFGANVQEHPEFANPFAHTLLEALRAQNDVEWTVLAVGWLADYVVPSKNRFHTDIGPAHPLDHNSKIMTIPGDGKYPVSFTSARDFAKCVASLMTSTVKWRPVIHVQSDTMTWLEIADLVKKRGLIPDLLVQFEPVEPLQKLVASPESSSPDVLLAAMLKLFSATGAAHFDTASVDQDRLDYFPQLQLRTVADLVDAAMANANAIV